MPSLRAVALALLAPTAAAQKCTYSKLKGYYNMQYTTGIYVGTPGQYQEILPDSGSYVLVTLGAQLPGHNVFKYDNSKTIDIPNPKKEYEIEYGSANAYGKCGTDNVRVKKVKSSKVEMLIDDGGKESVEPGGMYYAAAFDGVAGLGPTSFKGDMLGGFGYHDFGFKMSKQNAGSLTLGCPVAGYKYEYVKMIGSLYWTVPMQAVCAGDDNCFTTHSGPALIDSGTSLVYLPEAVVTGLNNKIGNVKSCSTQGKPTLTFKFGTSDGSGGYVEASLKPSEYIIQEDGGNGNNADKYQPHHSLAVNSTKLYNSPVAPPKQYDSGECRTVFEPADVMSGGGPMAILGMPFLRAHAVHFDRNGHKMGISTGKTTKKKTSSSLDGAVVPPEDDWEKDDPWDTGPLKVSLGAAILPFRDGDHKPQNGLKAAVQAKYGSGSFPHEVNGPNKQKKYFDPPQDVIRAAKKHKKKTGEDFDWWIQI